MGSALLLDYAQGHSCQLVAMERIMKFRLEIDINLPRNKVVSLFDNVDNLKHWQPELVSFSHLRGTPGQIGAQSALRYNMGGKECELIETITARNLPDEFSGTYEMKGVWNKIENRFVVVNDQQTRWIADNEFRCGGFMKVLGWLMPGMFKKQSFKYMQQFKAFAESA